MNDVGWLRAGRGFAGSAMATLVMICGASGVAQAADACPNAGIRAQQHAEHLADCGAYEMVSPPDKKGGSVLFLPQNSTGLTALSAGGDRAVFTSYSAFGDARSGMPASYVAHRSASGWTSNAASPPPAKPNPDLVSGGDAAVWMSTTPDLSFGVTSTRDTFDPGDLSPSSNDLYRIGIDETPSLITQGNSGPVSGDSEFAALRADGAVFFRTDKHLVPGDASRTAGMDVYVRAGGQTSLLSRKSDGTAAGTCGAFLGNSSYLGGTTAGAISDDGSSVVYTTPDRTAFGSDPDCFAPEHIYAARSGGQTLDVSASQRSVPDPAGPAPAEYTGATPDGSRIFFRSSEMLTDDAQPGGGLYEYDAGTGTLSVLVSSSDFVAVGMSDDAAKIYFMASQVLAAGAPADPIKLYTIDTTTNEVAFVTADPTASFPTDFQASQSSTSPVGDFAFGSKVQLTAFDNAGFVEVYLYRAQSKELTCVSCDPAGQRPSTSKARSDATIITRVVFNAKLEPSFSADGKRLVFQSGDQLVPEDTNHAFDVYAYEDGRLSLVSSGRGDRELLCGRDQP